MVMPPVKLFAAPSVRVPPPCFVTLNPPEMATKELNSRFDPGEVVKVLFAPNTTESDPFRPANRTVVVVSFSVMPECRVRLREVDPEALVLTSIVAGSLPLMLSNVIRPKTRVLLTVKLAIVPMPLRLSKTTSEFAALGGTTSPNQLDVVDQDELPPPTPPSQ